MKLHAKHLLMCAPMIVVAVLDCPRRRRRHPAAGCRLRADDVGDDHPQTKRDWKAFGVFSAFIVALFTEMYGYPLTVYLLSSWLGGNVLGLDLTHNGGHLWVDLVGWKGDSHLSPFHIASYVAIIGGFSLIATAWRVLYAPQRKSELAVWGRTPASAIPS